nr:hypothetical protein [Tanacetum cinerariifolium]
MHTDELYKFSDGMLNDVRSALHDIAARIRTKYLPMRKWSNLDKKRARVKVQDIDKQLYQRRLMRNLEKFIGGRVYGNDLRLLSDMKVFTMMMEILLKPTSNKLLVAGNPINEILFKLNLPDHKSILTDLKVYIKMDMEVPGFMRLTRFIATCSYSTDVYKEIIKAQLSYQEKYEHVGLEVTRSQEGKRSRDDDKRLCLIDDLKEFKITFITIQRHKLKLKVNDHYINSQDKD